MSGETLTCPRCGQDISRNADYGTYFCGDCGLNVGAVLAAQGSKPQPTGVTVKQGYQQNRPLPGVAITPPVLGADGVPQAIKCWSWPAFIFGWLWCFFNNLPIWGIASLLGWIFTCGFVGFFIDVWLGAKGNEYAWRANRYPSVAAYRRSQLGWEIMVWILVGTIVLSVAWIWLQFHR